ncbi:hypothetical protein EXU85_33120 [Spirosoma sp. KCTC 42546]|uniref:hypothetical protein n=1 Tax=Spirosoma sp. KCTC 42546 TaxID=2520506 RepID=UPI00115945EE|nr:hypothetical protein [Spirosoma sp. KCTC 42546]QDK83186.1 hypothetical protein EXU85_33120 [Spirosoma sp. KCTC 42546]
MKKVLYLSLSLLLTTLLIECKETNEFSPGASDARITGTWRLTERRYPVDSAYYLFDSVFVKGAYVVDSTFTNGHYVKDTVFVKDHYQRDSILVSKSIDSTQKYSVNPAQTLTFSADGKLSANGAEMSYYYPIKYFRVDSTISDGLGINLFITTNRATVPFRQGVAFQGDVLTLLPRCDRLCYSKFVRVR